MCTKQGRARVNCRASRLLLSGVRLSDLALNGRLHAASLAATDAAKSRRLRERAFRLELEGSERLGEPLCAAVPLAVLVSS